MIRMGSRSNANIAGTAGTDAQLIKSCSLKQRIVLIGQGRNSARIAANIAKLLSCSAARFSRRDLIDGRRGRLRGIFSARSLPRVFAIGLAGRIVGADSSNNLLPRVVQCVAE